MKLPAHVVYKRGPFKTMREAEAVKKDLIAIYSIGGTREVAITGYLCEWYVVVFDKRSEIK